jgi:hypothetical protein
MTIRAHFAPSSLLCWMRQIGLRIDDGLRRWKGVREYNHDPQCVFRMQPEIARRDVTLTDGTVMHRGDRLVLIHLWNEQVPEIPPGGPTLVWGRTLGRMMGWSLHELANFLAVNPEFDNALAIRADLALATSRHTAQLLRIMQHFGFEAVPETGPTSSKERIHRCGENILGLLLVLAVNPELARLSILWRVRSTVMISRTALDRRYGRARHAGGSRAECNSHVDPVSGAPASRVAPEDERIPAVTRV